LGVSNNFPIFSKGFLTDLKIKLFHINAQIFCGEKILEAKIMEKLFIKLLLLVIAIIGLAPSEPVIGQRRVVVRPNRVVVHRPAKPSRLVIRTGHPIRRVLPASVVVRPVRRVVTVGVPLVFLPSIVWTPVTALTPPAERLVWQDTESIGRDEGWVDSSFGVDSSGNALFIDINGTARLNFAEITFANGQVQIVDFNDQAHRTGVYKLLDFADGRHVKIVRILAKSEADESKLIIYLSKS
jgi:hypothetical protein